MWQKLFLLLLASIGPVVASGPPGTVIAHSPASSRRYLGCPSIAILPNGTYIASHSKFGPSNNREAERRSFVYRSLDKGKHWTKLATIEKQWWSTLFIVGNDLYILGTSGRKRPIVIRRSRDGGKTWTLPRDKLSGILFDRKCHCAPTPVLFHNGRVWKAFETSSFGSFMMSAPIGSDLLDKDNWIASNSVPTPEPYGKWLEGNAVKTTDGGITIILRIHEPRNGGVAGMVKVSDNGRKASFDRVITFPGGCKKFTIRYDKKTRMYWSIVNWVHPDDCNEVNKERVRNTMALSKSRNLLEWRIHSILVRDCDTNRTGFQYTDWLFNSNDIIAVTRTAYSNETDTPANCHDSNYITFHRFRNFRNTNLCSMATRTEK